MQNNWNRANGANLTVRLTAKHYAYQQWDWPTEVASLWWQGGVVGSD